MSVSRDDLIDYVTMESRIPLVYLVMLVDMANRLQLHPDELFLLALDKFFNENELCELAQGSILPVLDKSKPL